MLMCKPHGEEFRYKRAVDLAKFKVEVRDTGDTGNWGHQFVLSEISNSHVSHGEICDSLWLRRFLTV